MTKTKEPIINIEKLNQIPIDVYKNKNPNSFPFWVFPKPMQDIIFDCKETLNFPIDFLSSSILFTVGLANGLSTRIEAKKDWTETSAIYLAIVGRAGTNKSHPLAFALKPIFKRDKDNYNKYELDFNEYLTKDSADKAQPPIWNRTIIQDATIEAITNIHLFNKKGIGVYSDELKGWLSNMNKYSNGSDEEFWLSTWSNKPVIVDRSSKSVKSKFIETPFIPVIGTIQPKVLQKISNSSKSENGFMDRILFVVPKNLKKEIMNDRELSDITKSNYSVIINNILDYKLEFDDYNNINSLVLKYTEDARDIFNKWNYKNTKRYNDATNTDYDGLYSKMDIYIHRIALILQIMADACQGIRSNKITEQSIKGSVEIVEYFIIQAQRMKVQGRREALIESDVNKKRFYNDLPNEFYTKQALEIGFDALKLNKRYIERFLSESGLFEKVKRGFYRKLSI